MNARIRHGVDAALAFAWAPPAEHRFRRAQVVFLALLFLLGATAWMRFFACSKPEAFFQAIDWDVEEEYDQVIQETYCRWHIPYHVSEPIQPIQPTQRFLAIPESLYVFAPQAPLLALLTVKQFVIVNALLHYIVGFWGCLLLRKRFGLSPLVFGILVLLFNFNGHIVAHLAAGHRWNGYFYLPFFVAFVLDALKGVAPVFETATKIALVTLFILLQGSLHPYAHCMLLLGLVCLCNSRARATLLLAGALSLLLCVFRLLPAALTLRKLEPNMFVAGYSSLMAFLRSVVSVQLYPNVAFPWEYDLYLSGVGLAFLLVFGVGLRFSRRPEFAATRFHGLGLPLLVLAALSFRDYFLQLIIHLPAWVPNTERVSSRFMLLPLIFLLAIACVRLQTAYRALLTRRWLGAGAILGILVLAGLLWSHLWRWRMSFIEYEFESCADGLVNPHIITLSDQAYRHLVQGSLAFSILVLVILIVVWWAVHRGQGDARVSAGAGP